MLTPLEGYAKEPLVSLEEAVYPLKNMFCDDIHRYVYIAKQNVHKPADNLTCDESASIHLYSMQWSAPEDSLYIHLNRALRSVNRQAVLPWFCYLKLFLTALFKLPAHKGIVWRGVRGDLSKQYKENEYITWWGVSSCSANVKVIENFLGDSGDRTLFAIETTDARNIRAHSFYSKEEEIVLFPGTYLRVTSKIDAAKGLTLIHLREHTPPFPFLANPLNIVTHQEDVLARASRPSAPKKKPAVVKSKSPHKHSIAQQPSNQTNNKLKPLPKKK